MARDELEQLLRAADASAAAPPLLSELPACVRQRQQRRRHLRFVAGTSTSLVLLALASVIVFRPAQPLQVVTKTSALPTRLDLARLDMQASLHEQTADQLIALSSRPPATIVTTAAGDSVLAEVHQQRDRAALILVYEADQAAREKRPDRARSAYRRTLELFPQTYWAAVARQRLKEMST